MKTLKLIITLVLMLLITKFALAFQFKQQIDQITKHSKKSSQCIPMSTNKFSFSENMEKEYIYYICKLNPNIKSFAFYYDINNREVASQILLPIKFESLQLANPLFCSEKKDRDKVIQSCKAFISSDLSGMHGNELIFSTPWTVVKDPKTIENFNK